MIIRTHGDMFDGHYDALINPVNCVGVMGKGLALEFKKRYPEMYEGCRKACSDWNFHPGDLYLYRYEDVAIICFPTKDHWRDPSKLEYIEHGLKELRGYLAKKPNIRSVAVPKLGCGLGGLDWADVFPIVERELGGLDTEVYVFE